MSTRRHDVGKSGDMLMAAEKYCLERGKRASVITESVLLLSFQISLFQSIFRTESRDSMIRKWILAIAHKAQYSTVLYCIRVFLFPPGLD
jgi:hypothetical protein